jgi:hypothetical protein
MPCVNNSASTLFSMRCLSCTLTVRALGVLLRRRRHDDHAADLPIAIQPVGKHAQHAFRIKPVGLGPAGASVHEDACGLEHVGRGAICRQQSMQPKPVAPRLCGESPPERKRTILSSDSESQESRVQRRLV